MSKYVIEIPSTKVSQPIWMQQLRVAAYCRVSTAHEEQQQSLETQIAFYTDYIQRNPMWRFVAIYYDIASGTRTDKRPGYRQLLKDCGKGKIDLILLKSMSRFGRDTVEVIKQIRRLKKMNIGMYIEVGGFNTLTTSDSIIEQYAAISQAESHARSENIKFGIRHRMRSGKTMLNHTQFLGYTKCGSFQRRPRSSAKSLIYMSMAMALEKSNGIWRNMASKPSREKQSGAPQPLTGC